MLGYIEYVLVEGFFLYGQVVVVIIVYCNVFIQDDLGMYFCWIICNMEGQ